MAEDKSIISYDNIIAPTDVFDDLFSNLDSLEARLKKLAKEFNEGLKFINVNDTVAIEKQAIALRKLELAEEQLRLKKEALAKAQKKKIALTNQELIQLQKEKIVQKERIQRAKQLAIIQTQQGNTIKSLRAQLSLASLDWSKLTEKEIKNGKAAKLLSKRKLDLTNQLKRLEKQTGDNRRNVGNYTDSLSKLGKTAARVFLGRSAVDFFRRIVSGANAMIQANKKGNESLTAIDDSVTKAGGAFTKAAVVLLEVFAPAIVFILESFVSLVGLFIDLNEGSSNFIATSKELQGVTASLQKEFVKEVAAVDQVFTALEGANEGSKERKALIDQINTQYGQYLPNLLTEKSSLQDIEAAQRLVNDQLSKNFALKIQSATQTDIFINKIKSQNASFDTFRKTLENVGVSVDASLSPAFSELLDKFNDLSGEGEKANSAITGFAFNTEKTAEEIGKTNPKLAELIRKIAEYRGAISNDNFDGFVTILGRTARETGKYNDAVGESSSIINELNKGLITSNNSLSGNTSRLNKNTTALKDNTAERLKAIEDLQDALGVLEVESIENRQKRALALEDLRFKEEQKLREQSFDAFVQLVEEQEVNLIAAYGKNDKRVIAFRDAAGKELLSVEALNLKLSEEQLIQSEENKIKILEDFDKKREDRAKKAVNQAKALIKKDADDFTKTNKAITDEQQKQIQAEADLEQRARKEKNKKRLEDEKQLSKDIISLTAETSKAIQSIFDAEVKGATDAVDAQVTAVSNAEARAKAGLKNTLKFEQEQLATKELQRQQAEKRAKQAAEALALINLTVAAAQSGDKNAVQTGLIQFGVLKGLVAAIGSFYRGTEDTGTVSNPLDSKGGRLAVLHNNERVVTAKQNKALGDMTNEQLVDNAIRGAAKSDYQNPSMFLGSSHYQQQTKQVLNSSQATTSVSADFSGLKDEMRATRRAIEKKPVVQETITGIINDVVTVARKTTTNRMTRAETIKKRL